MGVPTKDEISTLTKRVEELTKAVERLKPTGHPTLTGRPAGDREGEGRHHQGGHCRVRFSRGSRPSW